MLYNVKRCLNKWVEENGNNRMKWLAGYCESPQYLSRISNVQSNDQPDEEQVKYNSNYFDSTLGSQSIQNAFLN